MCITVCWSVGPFAVTEIIIHTENFHIQMPRWARFTRQKQRKMRYCANADAARVIEKAWHRVAIIGQPPLAVCMLLSLQETASFRVCHARAPQPTVGTCLKK